MPWCPKCKNEYRSGITTCAECGIPLVDELEDANEYETCDLTLIKKKDQAIRLVKYLRYSGITYVDIKPDTDLHCYHIEVNAEEKKSAIKYLEAFCIVEQELKDSIINTTTSEESAEYDESEEDTFVRDNKDDSFNEEFDDNDSTNETSDLEAEIDAKYEDLVEFEENEEADVPEDGDEVEEEVPLTSDATYTKKEDVYKDQKSSASIFLFFSVAGIIFLGLNIAGVLHIVNGIFSFCVMGALFVAFFFLGLYSLKKAKEAQSGIDKEQELTAKINEYLDSLGDIPSIDEDDWADLSDEILYFKRTTKLKQMVKNQLGTMDDSYLDVIVEEYYDNHIDGPME